MLTATRTIGPADAGLRMTWAEYQSAIGQEGYRYELIDGRVTVLPVPNPQHQRIWRWIYDCLSKYSEQNIHIINYVVPSSSVLIEARPDDTAPEPDITAYRNYPLDREQVRWEEVSPILVVEIISPGTANKDLERNVELYLAVPTIMEYWIVDPRNGLSNTTMRVYRRRGPRWQKPIDLRTGDSYTTRLLPGFSLLIDPLA
jgi:Uma2 family endonuclease